VCITNAAVQSQLTQTDELKRYPHFQIEFEPMKLSRVQFRIRSLLIAATLFSVAFALVAAWRLRGEQQRKLVAEQQKLGAAVSYALEPDSLTAEAAEALGVDMVANPKELFVNTPPGTPVDIEGIVAITSLEHLAFCATGLVDDDLRHLKNLPKLKFLNLSSTDVTDRGVAVLTNLHLISLHLEQTAVSDASAESLAKIKTLMYLCLDEGAMSESALQRIREALPDCKVNLVKPLNRGQILYVVDDQSGNDPGSPAVNNDDAPESPGQVD
jgi:hypothetical protein